MIQRARWSSYRTTQLNPSVGKCYIEIVSHVSYIIVWCSIFLEAHYSPGVQGNGIQHVLQPLLQIREAFFPAKAFSQMIKSKLQVSVYSCPNIYRKTTLRQGSLQTVLVIVILIKLFIAFLLPNIELNNDIIENCYLNFKNHQSFYVTTNRPCHLSIIKIALQQNLKILCSYSSITLINLCVLS